MQDHVKHTDKKHFFPHAIITKENECKTIFFNAQNDFVWSENTRFRLARQRRTIKAFSNQRCSVRLVSEHRYHTLVWTKIAALRLSEKEVFIQSTTNSVVICLWWKCKCMFSACLSISAPIADCVAARWRMNQGPTCTSNEICCLLDIWTDMSFFRNFFLYLCSQTHLTSQQWECCHAASWFTWFLFVKRNLTKGKHKFTNTSTDLDQSIWSLGLKTP